MAFERIIKKDCKNAMAKKRRKGKVSEAECKE